MCFLICFVEAQHFIKYQNNIKKYHDIFRVCRNRRDPDISQSVSKVAFVCYISCISYSCLRFKGFVYLNLYTFNHDCGPCGMPAICQSIHHCIFQRITDSACIGWIFGYVGHYSSMSRKYHDMLRTGAWYLENISWYVGNRCLISWYVLKISKDIMICWEPVPDILKISWYFLEKTRAYQKISWYFLATWWDIAEYQKNQKYHNICWII